MTSVDVRTLPDPILIRLHLVSAAMMSEQEAEEATDWRQIAFVTEREIRRRGVSADEVGLYRVLDAESQRLIVTAVRRRQQQERSADVIRPVFTSA
jgi:hypothetical protein